MKDITKTWINNRKIEGTISYLQEYTINGTLYKVDNRHVILRPTKQELRVAVILSEKYGKNVKLIPQIMYPFGIQTPDYLIDNERFDLKSPVGMSKNLLYGMVAKKKKQSPNFIFEISNCSLTEANIKNQINGLYASKHTKFIKKIILIKNGKILNVYDR